MTIKDRVLVVEDEKSISGLIKAILTANGYDVITASTGNEAFSMISSHWRQKYFRRRGGRCNGFPVCERSDIEALQ